MLAALEAGRLVIPMLAQAVMATRLLLLQAKETLAVQTLLSVPVMQPLEVVAVQVGQAAALQELLYREVVRLAVLVPLLRYPVVL
jgi:hypothetical protein